MTPTIQPIAPWPLIVVVGMVLLGLAVWVYAKKLRGTDGAWRWFALGLRVFAVLMCLFAALRPSLLLMRKDDQNAAIVFLLDDSSSMAIADEANGRSRFEVARTALDEGLKALEPKKDKVELKTLRFADKVHEDSPGNPDVPTGASTAIGTALDEAIKLTQGLRLAAIVLLSEGQNNAGPPPLQLGQRLKGLQTPIIAVRLGSETAGNAARDLVARDLTAGPMVFIKNQPAIRAQLLARGFANQTVDVELFVEDNRAPAASKRVQVKNEQEPITINDFKWVPERAGETKLTFRVKPKEGELVRTNNEISTYVTVQSGGLNVLYLAGPGTVWEQKYLTRALDAAQEIQVTTRVLRDSARRDPAVLPDEELAPGRYDVIMIGDVPADDLTDRQYELIKRCVERGAGLMMLGGRSSFGSGGWAATALAQLIPTSMRSGDGQLEPEAGLKLVPNPNALDNYVLRIGATPAESLRLWNSMPPIPGANQLGPAKESAVILARAETGEPLMVAQDLPPGRVLVFGGETWPWARLNEETQAAHRRFWRQVILWLAHKEDQGANQIKLSLDRRRVPLGGKLDLTVTARDAKGEAISDLSYETNVEPANPAEGSKPQAVQLFNQATEARGPYFANGPAGEYRVTVIGRRDGQEVGRDTARFLVYQDDRELENPAADHALLNQLAELTGGAAVSPENLADHLRKLELDDLVETFVQKEVRLWDNWPFLLIFTAILTVEWWLRKRHGWV